jgi:TetR/AcrR family transcriptional regulator
MNYIAERRLEEKDRRRAEILGAAESVAIAEGIDMLTMDQVARQARISRALLYVYFKDKIDLHLGLCERGLEIMHERFAAAAVRNTNGLAQLQAMGRAYVAFAQEFPVYFETLARFHASEVEIGTATGCLSGCLEQGNRVHLVLVAAVEAGMRDGSIDIDAGKPAAIAMTLWGFMHGIILISTTKAGLLSAHYGLSASMLVEQALQLASRSLAAAKS